MIQMNDKPSISFYEPEQGQYFIWVLKNRNKFNDLLINNRPSS